MGNVANKPMRDWFGAAGADTDADGLTQQQVAHILHDTAEPIVTVAFAQDMSAVTITANRNWHAPLVPLLAEYVQRCLGDPRHQADPVGKTRAATRDLGQRWARLTNPDVAMLSLLSTLAKDEGKSVFDLTINDGQLDAHYHLGDPAAELEYLEESGVLSRSEHTWSLID